jgi:uncharacterized membrane protein
MSEKWNDERVAHGIAAILKWGTLLALSVVLWGGVIYLIHFGSQVPSYHVFHGQPKDLRTVNGIISDAMHGDSRGLIELGVVFLMATPIARVAFSVFAWAKQRDYAFVVLTLIVLGVLVYSMLGATII